MIEIVRKAATIAAVQRSQGGTHGAFKNDAIFNWLRGKCPLQEIVSVREQASVCPFEVRRDGTCPHSSKDERTKSPLWTPPL